MIAQGNKPNLANQAGNYRDTNNEHLVWIMYCVKVWAWEEATKVNAQKRLFDLEQAWRRGALVDTLEVPCDEHEARLQAERHFVGWGTSRRQ